MVTKEHEAPIDLFHRFPALLPELMRQLKIDVDIPDSVRVDFSSERCTENTPAELTADGVPLLKEGDITRVAVVFEVQRVRVEAKRGVWTKYVAAVWSRHQVPTVLLVYCENLTEAKKAAEPIHLGPGNVVTPVVVSPASLPPITDVEEYAHRVDLAVFAAVLHSGGPHARQSLDNLTKLLATIAAKQAEQYAGCLIEILPDRHKEYLEDLMTAGTYAYQDAFTRIEARGEARGEAKMLLRVLAGQGFSVSDELRDLVMSCGDTAQLESWADRVVAGESLDEIFQRV